MKKKRRASGLFDDSDYFFCRKIDDPLPESLAAPMNMLKSIKGIGSKAPVLEVFDPKTRRYYYIIPRAELLQVAREFVDKEENEVNRTLLRFVKRTA